MKKELGEPIKIEFDGWDAEENKIDAYQFGRSVQGAARLYRSAYHFYFTGQLPARLQKADVRVLVGPPQPGTLTYLIWLLLAHGRLAVYPQVISEFVDICAPEIVKTALAKLSGNPKVAEKSIEVIQDVASKYPDLANRFGEYSSKVLDYALKVEEGHQRDKSILHTQIDILTSELARKNTNAAISLVEPVGRSVKQLTHAKQATAELIIDEPAADAIRAKGELEVMEVEAKKVRLVGVDVPGRTCKIMTDEYSFPVRGKITDPAIETISNIYTHALHERFEIIITAKPVLKDGELVTLYISDARKLRDGE